MRFQKLRGNRCIYICADDTHGTAIMIRARQEGRSEEALIADMREHHVRDFAGFDIEFDNYGSTNSPENRRLCGEILVRAAQGRHGRRARSRRSFTIRWPGHFWPIGSSKAPARSASRRINMATVATNAATRTAPSELIDPVSTLSGAKPELRSAPHLFIELEAAARVSGRVDRKPSEHLLRRKWPTI